MLAQGDPASAHLLMTSLGSANNSQGLALAAEYIPCDPFPSITAICDPNSDQSSSLLKPGSWTQHF